MLSIGKLANPEYVLKGIAQSPEEYYLGHGEATGVWLGSGRSEFGLDGEVDADTLRSIIAGEDPASGTRLAAKNRRIAGYDRPLRYRPGGHAGALALAQEHGQESGGGRRHVRCRARFPADTLHGHRAQVGPYAR